MRTREATVADIPALVAMGERFLAEPPYAGRIGSDREAIEGLMHRMIAAPDCTVLVIDGDEGIAGMIGMMAYRHPISGDLVAGEVFWRSEAAGRGVSLMWAAERWARGMGVRALQMVAPTGLVGRIYAARGYRQLETVWQREIA